VTQPRERYPRKDAGWRPAPARIQLPKGPGVLSASAWTNGKLLAISALEDGELPDGSGSGPQWHISISELGKRPTLKLARRALKVFGLEGAEEDNHEPGNAKHFWMPVDPEHRVDCECKVDEVTVVEPDGHRWSNAREPELCRGCEFQRLTGNPCSLHGATRATVSSRVLAEPVEDSRGPAPSGRDRRAAAPDTSQEAQVGNATTPHTDPGNVPASGTQAPDLSPRPARRLPLRAVLALVALTSLDHRSRSL
jgi:hypothetical protein